MKAVTLTLFHENFLLKYLTYIDIFTIFVSQSKNNIALTN